MLDSQRDLKICGLLYMYEYAYTIDPQSYYKNKKFVKLLIDLEVELNHYTTLSVGQLPFNFLETKNYIFTRYELTEEDYKSFKNGTFSIKTKIDKIINGVDENKNIKVEHVLTLWYVYECIYTCNIKIVKSSKKERLLLDLQELVGFTPANDILSEIEKDIQEKFDLTFKDYWKFKKSDNPLKEEAYKILFQKDEEICPNTKHVSNIPGIAGKGDLSKKAHYRALNPDLNKDTALAFTFGKNKHGNDNFRKMDEQAAGELWDALMRHLEAYRLGETHADDSKQHHIAHACANLHMIYRLIKRNGDDKVLEVITGGDISGLKRT